MWARGNRGCILTLPPIPPLLHQMEERAGERRVQEIDFVAG
jgi:hypothetical protein